jgi:signal transduction histidine kinase
VAKSEVARLDTIIAEFLKAIRPSRPRLAPTRVGTVLKDTLAVLKQEFENRNIRVEVDCQEPLPRIQMDRNQIKQAFFNNIKNAMQAMVGGGLLRISAWSTDRFVAISFQDAGHGIAPGDFGRIFEPYYTTKPDGSGLGLMIVQRIVQDHGGRIDVRSAPNAGTTFTVLLPSGERRVRLLKPARPEDRDEKEDA